MNNPSQTGELFSLYWENSKFNAQNIRQISQQIAEDSARMHDKPQLFYPTEDLKLYQPKDTLAKIMASRHSGRKFSDKPLTEKQLGSLFYGFATKEDGTRLLPSGGGKYPIEVFACLYHVQGKLNGKVVYYNADTHSLSVVADSPPWSEMQEPCCLFVDDAPAVMFVFVAFAERSIVKYGERGGRFALIEAGHYAQNLGLRIEQEGLAGVEVGGVFDDYMKKILELEKTKALITLGFAVGDGA